MNQSMKMKRRRRRARHKRILTERRHRAEDRRFYDGGPIPMSASVVSICSCGARAYSRDRNEHLDGFTETHAYCDDVDDEYTDWSDGDVPLLAVPQ